MRPPNLTRDLIILGIAAVVLVGTPTAIIISIGRRLRARRERQAARHIPQPVTRDWYRNIYLNSAHWQHFRRTWWRTHRSVRACAHCGRWGIPLDLHHLTYERLGCERPDDVQPICRWCHDAEHDQEPGDDRPAATISTLHDAAWRRYYRDNPGA